MTEPKFDGRHQMENVLGYVEESFPAVESIAVSTDKKTGHYLIDVVKDGKKTQTVIRKDDYTGVDEEAVAVAFVTWVEEVVP